MERPLRIALPLLSVALIGGALQQKSAGADAVALLLAIAAAWATSGAAIAWHRAGGVTVTAAIATAVALYLGVQHDAAPGTSFCSVSQTFDCDVVNQSAYSEIMGVPLGFLGMALYAGVLALGAAALARGPWPHTPHTVLAAGLASVLVSVPLAGISGLVLGTWCLLCICLYGLNALLAVGGWAWTEGATPPRWEGVTRVLSWQGGDASASVVGITGVLALIATQALSGATPAKATDKPADQVTAEDVASLYSLPDGPVQLQGSEPSAGPPSATYTVVEYADFECPHCGRVFPGVHDLAKAPDVQVLFKNYPLNQDCNGSVETRFHENACHAAAAAECARQQGKFWELAAFMFKNQQNLTPDDIAFMAKQSGVDPAILAECMADPATAARVKLDTEHGDAAGVHGTPSLFVRGLFGEGWVRIEGGPDEAKAVIDAHRRGVALPPARAAAPH